jgi:cell fate regulator YaaT (PSP1 superfamily)
MNCDVCTSRTIEGGEGVYIVLRHLHSGESEIAPLSTGNSLRAGDLVVVPTRFGDDLSRVVGELPPDSISEWGDPIEIVRLATDGDVAQGETNDAEAEFALESCRNLIEEHSLDMTLVSAHYVLDRSKLVIFFCAESRVDFRDLVKDLVHEFRVRIELRQIGVRDEARIVGGIGICGRVLCCHGVSDRLNAVSIKMAKAQNLSLNSMKISGPCGRLLCCLEYEYDFYREVGRSFPPVGARCQYQGETTRVQDVNFLTGIVKLSTRDRLIDMPVSSLQRGSSRRDWVADSQTSEE